MGNEELLSLSSFPDDICGLTAEELTVTMNLGYECVTNR
jgi:hypothetical protein